MRRKDLQEQRTVQRSRPRKIGKALLCVLVFLLLGASCNSSAPLPTGGELPEESSLTGSRPVREAIEKEDAEEDPERSSQTEVSPTLSKEGIAPGDTIRLLGSEDLRSIRWALRDPSGTRLLKEANDSDSLLIEEDYNEHFLDCTYTDREGESHTLSVYISKLPVIYLESEIDYRSVNKTFRDASVRLVSNDRYGGFAVDYEGEAELKLRGNSTSERDKKPFALKLKKKEQLLGLGTEKNRHWVLLANDIDHTHLRNEIVHQVGSALGNEPSCDLAHVVLIYNGEYEGLYQLGEQVRVDPGRVEIYDWEKTRKNAANAIAIREWQTAGYDSAKEMEDALEKEMSKDFSWIDEKKAHLRWTDYALEDYGIELPEPDGGYLLEMDFYALYSPYVASLTTAYGQPLYFNTPEPGSGKGPELFSVADFKKCGLYENAEKYVQTVEYALHSPDLTFHGGDHTVIDSPIPFDWNNEYEEESGWKSETGTREYFDPEREGKHYSELIDPDSFVSYYLATEYSMNWDSMKNSFFVYKDLSTAEDPRLKAGPLWDYDFAFGNINMFQIDVDRPEEWQTTSEYFTYEQVYQSYNWFRSLIRDPYFLIRAYEAYHQNEEVFEDVIREGGLIDRESEYLKEAALANDRLWEYTYDRDYSGAVSEHFEDATESLKDFIQTRDAWLKKQFADPETLIASTGYYHPAEELTLEFSPFSEEEPFLTVTATLTEDSTACGLIRFRLDGTYCVTAPVRNKTAKMKISRELWDSFEKNPDHLMHVVVAEELDPLGNELFLEDWMPTGNFEPMIRSNYVYFTSE